MPVTQVEPPPAAAALLLSFQVSLPGSPLPGIVWVRQTSFWVARSVAAIQPRMPYSAPATPGDRHVLDDQRRAGDDLALVRIGDRTLPRDLAGFLVGRDQPAIERVGNDEIAPQCDAAIIDAAARHRTSPVTVRLGIHLPDQHAAAAMRIDLVDRAPSIGDVEKAVLGNGRAFQPAMTPDAAAFDAAEVHGPGDSSGSSRYRG